MERALILLIGTLMLFVAPNVRGTAHLSFANNTEVDISRAGCGMTKVCVETPADCDPAGNSTCLFASVNASSPTPPNGTDLSLELSGNSTGYIAVGLSADASEGTTMLFICAQDNGTFFFRTMTRNNSDDTLSPNERITTEIRGTVNGDMIQCEFIVPDSNSTTFNILLGSGTVNGTAVGPFMVSLRSESLDVANPAGTTTTQTPMTTSGASDSIHTHAVLLLLGVLSLSVLKTA